MHAVIGRVKIKADRADEALSMIKGGVAMVRGLREMPDAPATFVSVEVCEVIGRT
jgi:hypothetical protein